MFYWMQSLPEVHVDREVWQPFIRNSWFREHYMWFVRGIQLALVILSMHLGVYIHLAPFVILPLTLTVFVVHELCHFAVICGIGDISLTFSGLFFWLNSGAEMSKTRYWVFMTLPLLLLTVLPCVCLACTGGKLYLYLRCTAWINAVIAGSDIINSVLILLKPAHSRFYRGYFRAGNKGE